MTSIKSGKIIRYRGMVQDLWDPEYVDYANAMGTDNSNGSDYLMNNMTSFVERTPMFLTPIPFTSPWYQNELIEQAKESQHLEFPDRTGSSDQQPPYHNCDKDNHDQERSAKRLRRDIEQHEKHLEPTNFVSDNSTSQLWWDSNKMKTSPNETPALAMFYYDEYKLSEENIHQRNPNVRKLQLNDIVEIVGQIEWEFDENENAMTDDNVQEEIYDMELTPSVPTTFPRIHVLWYQVISSDHNDASSEEKPTIGEDLVVASPTTTNTLSTCSVPNSSKPRYHEILATLTKMDYITSKAVWITLLSMAERRLDDRGIDTTNGKDSTVPTWIPIQTPYETTLGCASLNIVASDLDSCCRLKQTLYDALRHIVPVVHVIDITYDSLVNQCSHNASMLQLPRKDASTGNHMKPSMLQLPKGSTIILNVGSLVLPQNVNKATFLQQNLMFQGLQCLAKNHSMPYVFECNVQIQFEADYRIIVLSTAATKDLLPCTLQVRWNENCAMNDISNVSTDTVTSFLYLRSQLSILRSSRKEVEDGDVNSVATPQSKSILQKNDFSTSDNSHKNISLSKLMLDRAQNDFVQRRKQASSITPPVGETEFHRWLTITRLMARNRKDIVASVSDWIEALQLNDDMHRQQEQKG